MVKEKAYAKLNLSLNVVGKMNNGFHELETIMVPVGLYDTLYFEKNNTDEMILINNKIEDNSVLRAAKLFKETYHTGGATIRIKKRIPLEAGLGGGSADSSATLRGLNRLFKLNIPLKDLEELAKKLGSDNVYCLYNKASICRGRGELLEFINYDFNFDVFLIKPQFGLSTKEVFKNLECVGDKKDISNILEALKNNDYTLLEDNIFNDLLTPAKKVNNSIVSIITKIENLNLKCFMSGSGTTFFVLIKDKKSIKKLKRAFKNEFLKITTLKSAIIIE